MECSWKVVSSVLSIFFLLIRHATSLRFALHSTSSGKILVNDCCCWMFHWPFAWLSPSSYPISGRLSMCALHVFIAESIELLSPSLLFISSSPWFNLYLLKDYGSHEASRDCFIIESRNTYTKKGVKRRNGTGVGAIIANLSMDFLILLTKRKTFPPSKSGETCCRRKVNK